MPRPTGPLEPAAGSAGLVSRRGLLGLALAGLVPLAAGCSGPASAAQLWHEGQLAMATGNNTGVYYQVGAGYADAITRHLRGYEAVAVPTNGSPDNLQRLAQHDVDIAIALLDVCSDAVNGTASFSQRLPLRALARLYLNYVHVVTRTDAGIRTLGGMRGKRVSTGSPNSGTEMMARRLLTVSGVDPDKDIEHLSLSLQESTDGMARGEIDAMFWSGGLPTLGITDLFNTARGRVALLPLDSVLDAVNRDYGNVYHSFPLKKTVYGMPADIPTITVPNLLMVGPELPRKLARDLTALIFEYPRELIAAHPEWKNVSRQLAPVTDPVRLHPGASDYYDGR